MAKTMRMYFHAEGTECQDVSERLFINTRLMEGVHQVLEEVVKLPPPNFKVSSKPVQLTLSSERSRNECAVAKNSNADRNSAL